MRGRFMVDPVHRRSVLLLVAAALCWSLGGVLIKSIAWPALAVASGRGLIAAVLLTVVCWRTLRFTWSPLQLAAAAAFATCTVLFTLANKLTTAANAILLQYTAPVWVALLGAWFLGERTTRADWLTIAAVLGGLALFFSDGLRLGDLDGMAVALASGVAFAAMILLLRRHGNRSTVEAIILGNTVGFLVGAPVLAGTPPLPLEGWLALGLLGVVQLGLAYLLYARALPHVTALEAVLIPVIEPILNPVWVMLRLGEKPTGLAFAGGLIVLAAVTARAVHSIRQPRPPPPAPA